MRKAKVSDTRVESIDALRAVTMLLMIWVNDFWRLQGIPDWLQHMPAEADALGFSDVIFPAFLFIVGLSIPFAINNRKKRGERMPLIAVHILSRSFALIVMGFFMVNLEFAEPAAMLIPKPIWQILMVIAFGLIWNAYPPAKKAHRRLFVGLRVAGCVILAVLALLYRGGDATEPSAWLQPHWWGILGLIGWSYLVCALLYLLIGRNAAWIAVCWAGLSLFNIAEFAGWLDAFDTVKGYVWMVGGGSMPALTMAGALTSTAYLQFVRWNDQWRYLAFLVIFGLVLIGLGFALRPLWGISKIQATPAWTQICAGISLLAYAAFYWLVDLQKKTNWTRALGAAGTATLTCYLVPYLVYPIFNSVGISLPQALKTGGIGLVTSMVFAFLIVWATEWLVRHRVQLKV